MHLCQPFSNSEDRLIGFLDSGVSIAQREAEAEADAIRLAMHLRERARLRHLLRAAKAAEAHP